MQFGSMLIEVPGLFHPLFMDLSIYYLYDLSFSAALKPEPVPADFDVRDESQG